MRPRLTCQPFRALAAAKGKGGSDLDLLSADISYFAAKDQTGVSLLDLTKTGTGEYIKQTAAPSGESARARMLFQVAMFLHRELPIRLAHRVRDLDSIPHLSALKGTRDVRGMYARSFDEIRQAPTPNTLGREKYFAEMLKGIYDRHSSVLLMMARAMYQLRNFLNKVEFADQEEIHSFLDNFYMSRIGIRMLIGQYLALREEPVGDGYVGLICQRTSPAQVCGQAMEDAAFMCRRGYGDSPTVSMHGRTDLTFRWAMFSSAYGKPRCPRGASVGFLRCYPVDPAPSRL